MPWIDDVVSHTTIRSVWGNNIRNHVVHTVASKAERDATVVPQEGMRVYCADTRFTYVRVGSAWWVESMPWAPFTPRAWMGTVLSAMTEVGVPSIQVASWRQSMGHAWVRATYGVSVGAISNVNSYLLVFVPVATSASGGLGAARAYEGNSGIIRGGAMGFYDHTAAGSRAILNGVAGQPANATINVPGGTTVGVDLDASYIVDPTRDG